MTLYESVAGGLQDAIAKGSSIDDLFEQYANNVEYNAFFSLYSHIWVRRMKREVRNYDTRRMAEILDRVKTRGESLFDIAMNAGFSPYKLAKMYTECAFEKGFDLSRFVKNPALVHDVRLRGDLLRCVSDDPVNCNRSDVIKATVGVEYEELLIELLHQRKICFETEAELRARGKPKTPDILLLIPMAVEVNGQQHIVNWIDSKGMFADKLTFHEQGEQLRGYVNRYGAGLVIYWYGFSEDVRGAGGQTILVVDNFPDKWIFPTGEQAEADGSTEPVFDGITMSMSLNMNA
jgi:hypothetical protein